MEIVRSRHRPRCADCGSSAIILQGECVWHLPSQAWRAVQPKLEQSPSGLITHRFLLPRLRNQCRYKDEKRLGVIVEIDNFAGAGFVF